MANPSSAPRRLNPRTRRAIIGTLTGLGAILLLLATIPFFVNLDRYRDQWLPMVESALGRRVDVGHVELTLLTGLGARIDGLVVHEDQAFGATPMLEVESARVRIKLFPLLRGHVAIKEIALSRPVLRIVKNESGDVNLASLGTPSPPSAPAEGASTGPSALAALSLADLRFREGSVSYEDRSTPAQHTRYEVDQIEATLQDVGVGQTLTVDLVARWVAADAPLVLNGQAGPLDDRGVPHALDLVMGLGDSRITVTGRGAPDGLAMTARSDQLNVAQLASLLRVLAPVIPSDLALSGTGGIDLTLQPRAGAYAVKGRVTMDQVHVAYATWFEKPPDTPLWASLEGELRTDSSGVSLEFPTVVVRLHTLEAKGRFDVLLGESLTSSGLLETGPVNLAGWQGLVPSLRTGTVSGDARIDASWKLAAGAPLTYRAAVAVKNVKASSPAWPQPITRLDGSVVVDGERVTIPQIAMHVGESDVTLKGAVTGFAAPSGTVSVSSQFVDLATLFPPVAAVSAGSPATGDAASSRPAAKSSAPTAIPAPVRAASIGLTLDAKRVKGPSMPELTHVKGAMRWTGGALDISRVTASVYGGEATMSGRIDPLAAAPRFTLKASVEKIQVGQALAQYTSLGEFLVGRLGGRIDLGGAGSTWARLAPTLAGQGDLAITEGAFRTFNLAKDVLTAVDALGATRLTERPDTPFQRLAASVKVAGGALHLDEARLTAQEYGMTASGTVGFDAAVDMRAQVTLPRSAAGSRAQSVVGAALADEDGRLRLPVKLGGHFPKPQIAVDRAALLDDAGRRLRERGSEKLKEFLDNAEQDGATSPRDLLKGLLKR